MYNTTKRLARNYQWTDNKADLMNERLVLNALWAVTAMIFGTVIVTWINLALGALS